MRRFFTLGSAATFVAVAMMQSPASALVVPQRGTGGTSLPLDATGALVAPPGAPTLRLEIAAGYTPAPRPMQTAWSTFVDDSTSPRWQALWDADTGRPLRIFGGYFDAPGTSADPAVAEQHARALLSRHADLLLAGRSIDELELVANDLARGQRTLGFRQLTTAGGVKIPVLGGRVSLRYRGDHLFMLGSEVLPVSPLPAPQLTESHAESAALSHLSPTFPDVHVVSTELVALPLVRTRHVRVALAFRVSTESTSPASLTDVFVDARDGSILATRENLRFLAGALKYEAPIRSPDEHALYPAPSADLAIDGIASSTDATGTFSFDPAAQSLSCYPTSDVVDVVNLGGENASLTFAPADGVETVWSMKDDELGDAQLSAFVHTSIAKDHARKIDPTMSFLNKSLTVRVNQDDPDYACNAYWNGSTVNFFQEFSPCNNTARLADVVYHEFGHAFHTSSILPGVGAFDPALGEGGADYFASIVTNDPYLAPGFFKSGGHLREFDSDRRWPDDISWDPHETGLIFAGAMWDLRTILTADLGPEEGPALTHGLYHDALRRASSLPTTFPEILASDDDDGDLGNGTPHVCQIVKAFAPHGLTPYVSPTGLTMTHAPLRVVPGQKEPYELAIDLAHAFPECAVPGEEPDSIEVLWRTSATGGKVQMIKGEGSTWTGALPGQIAGTKVRYAVVARMDELFTYLPYNAADHEYEVFVGDVTPIYCTGFEEGAEGWTFGEVSGKTTDFAVGAPYGKGGDPGAAYSGAQVIGTTLTELGLYRRNRESFADSPVIDVTGRSRVRIHFMRWLTVEDGLYDQATIHVNGAERWVNASTDGQDSAIAHEDREWRFQDLDVSDLVAAGATTLQVRFQLTSDQGSEYGGWNVDDFCVVSWEPPPPAEGEGGAGGQGGEGGSPGQDDPDGPGCACRSAGSPGDTPWGALAAALGLPLLLGARRASLRPAKGSSRGASRLGQRA